MFILRKCGFEANSLRAQMKAPEREAVISEWNSSDSDHDVLILNSAVFRAGLNVHHNCCTGIGIGLVWNAAVMHQFMGRLPRIGQTKPVTWHLVTIPASVSPWLEDRMLKRVCVWSPFMPTPYFL